MNHILRIVLIIVCILTCYYALHKIRKSQMQIEDSIFWILFSSGLVLISLFPDIAYFFANILGIGSPVNFVFLAVIFILIFKIFSISIKMSQLEYRIKNLVQQIAIKNHEWEEKNKEEAQNNK